MIIQKRIQSLKKTIEKLQILYQQPKKPLLLAVSKGQASSAIREAFSAGLSDFGENYWQEARAKLKSLEDLAISWHFIGTLQSNKVAQISRHFHWVHTVDRLEIAELLSKHRPSALPPLNLCIQLNLDNEPRKSGIAPKDLVPLVTCIQQLPRLKLRGLMAIPKPRLQKEAQYLCFCQLRNLLESVNQGLTNPLDTLSMGMSDDFDAAIRAGSTIIRLGRAVFGERRSTRSLRT